MNKEQIQLKVDELSEDSSGWNCYYEFPHGVVTRKTHVDSPGYNLKKWPRLESVLVDDIGLIGKSVVDVGCGDGYYAIQCANNGARYCFGTDVDSLRIKRAMLAKQLLQVDNVDFKAIDLFEVDVRTQAPVVKWGEEILNNNNKIKPLFDIVMGLGLLHRVPDLDSCLNKLAALGEYLVLEVKTLDDPRPIKFDKGGKSKSNQHNGLWSIPTESYLVEKMSKLNFKIIRTIKDEESSLKYKRTILAFKNEK